MLPETRSKDLSRSDLINEFAIKMVSVINAQELAWFVAREIVGSLGYEDCVIYYLEKAGIVFIRFQRLELRTPRMIKF